MSGKRANAVNRAIFKSLGGNLTPSVFVDAMGNNCPSWIFTPIKGSEADEGESFEVIDTVVDTYIESYATDMNAAMGAAGELLPGKWHVGMHPDYSDGFVFFWQYGPREEDNIESIHATLDTVPAAICEAIVTARGLVVESEVTSE